MITENATVAKETRAVAEQWFCAMAKGDVDAARECLADDVEWINYIPVPGMNTDMKWIGTYRGPVEVIKSLGVFLDMCDVKSEELIELIVDGEDAVGIVHETSKVKATDKSFEIEFVQWLKIRDGKIVRWKSYTDPSPIVRAIRG